MPGSSQFLSLGSQSSDAATLGFSDKSTPLAHWHWGRARARIQPEVRADLRITPLRLLPCLHVACPFVWGLLAPVGWDEGQGALPSLSAFISLVLCLRTGPCHPHPLF